MRSDMAQIITTRPRKGSSWKNPDVLQYRRNRDFEDLPTHSGMKPKLVGNPWGERKELSEHLNPLVRFLTKNCNRSWDKVYSEICKSMDRRSAIQGHIFEHLFDYVERNPIFINGKPYKLPYKTLIVNSKYGTRFYVDQQGILRKPKEKNSNSKQEDPRIHRTKTNLYLLREEDNVWFEAKIIKPESPFYWTSFCKKPAEWIVDLLGPWEIERKEVHLRTLTKKEKKAIGIA